ncbi:acyl-CoA thioesterase [Chondromyces apiculatus]|uniref:Putative 4-hydroxybenzoyl-CoA thioesterase n=1 Tax=Chondromyces apiculatus DSM 436 TaxID=1192034 RepID=A0A017TFQ3_9BACT|nr:thioesterase family protein [Chondromyces apiculatus]EYF08034.1 putative 4-hydroxybenzoyl-CoA thioesterase [Chondromyces apiculatus DSM 436]
MHLMTDPATPATDPATPATDPATPATDPATPATDASAPRRDHYPHRVVVPTRWLDNDVYGHVNNVVYYAYFDAIINRYLITEGGLDIATGPIIGLVVESHCRFRRPLTFPEDIDAGLRIGKLGRTSVRYELALFSQGEPDAAAEGWVVHVFVDRQTRRPAPLPDPIRAALTRLVALAPPQP